MVELTVAVVRMEMPSTFSTVLPAGVVVVVVLCSNAETRLRTETVAKSSSFVSEPFIPGVGLVMEVVENSEVRE